jgi:hypothetical protein
MKDAAGVELVDFDERNIDAVQTLDLLIYRLDVDVAALITLHSGSELILAGFIRSGPRNERIASYAYRSHLLPRSTKGERLAIAVWDAM